MSSQKLALLVGTLALGLTACPTNPTTTTTATDTDTDTDTDSTGTTEGPGTTTNEPVTTMPTTTDPSTTDETTDPTTDPSTTTGPPPAECGNGEVEDGEECDDGEGNSDQGACLSDCTAASCGDGFVWEGNEACDDGVNDGSYGGCMDDCAALGPSCGDGILQEEFEECDPTEPMPMADACNVSTCAIAKSCQELFDSLPDELKVSGEYPIKPDGVDAPLMPGAWCDMDNGGYTYVKWDDGGSTNASEAEAACSTLGLHLYWPTSPEHLSSAIDVAMNEAILPQGGGMTLADIGYLNILSIYPVTPGESCVGMPLNSADCPEWAPPGGGDYFVGAEAIDGQPGTSNCAGCSLAYQFDADTKMVTGYESFMNQGNGATALRWLCTALP